MRRLHHGGILGVVILAAALAGCASTGGRVYEGPSAWIYTAGPDSLGLDEFLALPAVEQQNRREMASSERVRAAQTRNPEERFRHLMNAGGLAPDDWSVWLGLARQGRWIGDYVQTAGWLENAQAAVRMLGASRDGGAPETGSDHWDAALATGLARGWLHFDRGDWREGMRWVNALDRLDPTNTRIQRVRALLSAYAGNTTLSLRVADGMKFKDMHDPDVRWIEATVDRARGWPSEAFNALTNVRPKPENAAVCYREMGETAELLGEYSHARRYYSESFHHLPLNDKSCLERRSYPRLGRPDLREPVEFWVAFGRFYVTGSRSAYAAWVWDRYEAATGAERGFWAGQAVNAAGILIRRELDQPWALRLRGLVFLESDELEKGLTDLRSASRRLKEQGLEDQRVEAALGHGLLLKERHERALPHLRRAVALDAQDAAAWADLGLALVMTKDNLEAEKALDRSLRLDPESATAWYNRGLLHLRAGSFAQAENDLSEAARLAPGNADVVNLLQRAHALQKRAERRQSGTSRNTE